MRLKPADKLDVVIPFDTEDAMLNPRIVTTCPLIEVSFCGLWFMMVPIFCSLFPDATLERVAEEFPPARAMSSIPKKA